MAKQVNDRYANTIDYTSDPNDNTQEKSAITISQDGKYQTISHVGDHDGEYDSRGRSLPPLRV